LAAAYVLGNAALNLIEAGTFNLMFLSYQPRNAG
jgi:hypothetical protein